MPATPAAETNETVISYKGFDQNFRCRGFQYEVGETYEFPGLIVACENGAHACEYPLDVLDYYEPATSRYALVTQSGALARHSDDTKIASAKITIESELHLPDLIERAVRWVFDHAKPEGKGSHATGVSGAASATGVRGAASATGVRGAASATGVRGAASATGVRGAASATGYSGAASATGHSGAASAAGVSGAASATGVRGAASATGDGGAASATGYRGAASATGHSGAASATGYRGAASATGDSGAASATGHSGAASAAGYRGAASATGDSGAASATGHSGRVMGADGCALFLVHRNSKTGEIKHAWAGIAGRDGIKPLTWYTLGADGAPIECGAV
jgi:hypothetical protein